MSPTEKKLVECALLEKLHPLLKFQIRESQAAEIGRRCRQLLSEN